MKFYQKRNNVHVSINEYQIVALSKHDMWCPYKSPRLTIIYLFSLLSHPHTMLSVFHFSLKLSLKLHVCLSVLSKPQRSMIFAYFCKAAERLPDILLQVLSKQWYLLYLFFSPKSLYCRCCKTLIVFLKYFKVIIFAYFMFLNKKILY